MAKPACEWDEQYILGLPLEDDSFERKGTRLLDLSSNEGSVWDELAKQSSAFANTGGGRIIYGITDSGTVDNGGVPRIARGRQSTKDWLEDIIPGLTEYEIVGFNVYEVVARDGSSTIGPEMALYIVDIPDSDRAPHQSKRDHKYYVRLGGKSLPASHRLIEDIRNRLRHPDLKLLPEIDLLRFPRESLPRIVGSMEIRLRLRLDNSSRLKATHTCIELSLNEWGASFGDYDNHAVHARRADSHMSVFLEAAHPVYPGMRTSFWVDVRFPAELMPVVPTAAPPRWVFGKESVESLAFSWRLFADNAPLKEGRFNLASLGFVQKARERILSDSAAPSIRNHYGDSIP